MNLSNAFPGTYVADVATTALVRNNRIRIARQTDTRTRACTAAKEQKISKK